MNWSRLPKILLQCPLKNGSGGDFSLMIEGKFAKPPNYIYRLYSMWILMDRLTHTHAHKTAAMHCYDYILLEIHLHSCQ